MADSVGLAYKAYEIEEAVDIYFYRRLGYGLALAARRARLTPNAVSVLAGIVGAAGGGLLASPRLAPAGVGLLVLHGVLDSADGQLARMTGRTSEWGRVLDGLAGYATHVALYLGIVAAVGPRWGVGPALALAALAGVCTAVHAQQYDYHRTAYAALVLQARVPRELSAPAIGGLLGHLVTGYAAGQQALLGLHRLVVAGIAGRAEGGRVTDEDRALYRRCFYRPVRGWNLLGDNVRRFAIAGCVALQHPEWFIAITLGPLNLVAVALWWYQQAADRRFLAESGPASPRTP